MRIERFLYRCNHLPLHRERPPRDARARRSRMAAAAKLSGDLVHVHFFAFGTQADARQLRFDFLKHTRNDNGSNRPDMIYEPLGIAAVRARAGIVGFLEPEIRDLIVMGEPKMAVDMTQQPSPRKRIRLINFLADLRDIGAETNQITRNMVRAGPGGWILK